MYVQITYAYDSDLLATRWNESNQLASKSFFMAGYVKVLLKMHKNMLDFTAFR